MSQSNILLSDTTRLASDVRTRTDVNGATFAEHYERTSEAHVGALPRPLAQFLTLDDSADLNVDGSSDAQTFAVTPGDSDVFRVEHLTLVLTLATAPSVAKFGDLLELASGLSLGVYDSDGAIIRSLTGGVSVQSNADLLAIAKVSVFEIDSTYALQARVTLGGPIRLDGGAGEYLALTVSDDLTAISSMRAFVAGKVESEIA